LRLPKTLLRILPAMESMRSARQKSLVNLKNKVP
jgi:hypothetical protein